VLYRTELSPVEPNLGKRRRIRFSLRAMPLVSTFVAVVLGLIISVGPLLINYFVFGVGPIWSRNSWPKELRTLVDSLPATARDDLRGVKVYCFENFIDEGYVWRFELPMQSYDELKQSLDLVEQAAPGGTDQFWSSGPSWWDPNPSDIDGVLYWNGSGSDVILLYDREKEVLYGWSYFDF
jgi:hypothetical protein